MSLVASNDVHECFEHTVDGLFDITEMRRFASTHQVPVLSFHISAVIAHIEEERVIDAQRVLELPEESWKFDPAMLVIYEREDGAQHLLVDGTHRILRRHREGLKTFTAYTFAEQDIIRPDMAKWKRGCERGIDWGDAVVDGRIVKR